MASEFAKVAKLFEDVIAPANYFDSIESEAVKNALLDHIDNNCTDLIFLIGNPGVGKTFLMKYLINELFYKRQIFYYDTPFFDNELFLDKFIDRFDTVKYHNIVDKKNRAVELAKKNPHTIFVDEAQLLSNDQVEFLRTLSDSKAFQIIMAMHKDEGEAILKKKHFKSRKKQVVTLHEIQRQDLVQYINNILLRNSFGEMEHLFTPRVIKSIQKYTSGNMRSIKLMLQTLFELLDHKKSNNMLKENRIERCLLMMAAIDVGLLDA